MAKNIWNKENTAKAVNLYTAKLEAEGKEAAADNDFLKTIAAEVGAASDKSVRSKLTTEGVYQKPDAVASVAKTNTVRKEHYVRALANTFGLSLETLDSFKNAKADALQALCAALGILDVMAAASKGYEIEPCQVVLNVMAGNGLDFDDLGDFIAAQTDEVEAEAETEAE